MNLIGVFLFAVAIVALIFVLSAVYRHYSAEVEVGKRKKLFALERDHHAALIKLHAPVQNTQARLPLPEPNVWDDMLKDASAVEPPRVSVEDVAGHPVVKTRFEQPDYSSNEAEDKPVEDDITVKLRAPQFMSIARTAILGTVFGPKGSIDVGDIEAFARRNAASLVPFYKAAVKKSPFRASVAAAFANAVASNFMTLEDALAMFNTTYDGPFVSGAPGGRLDALMLLNCQMDAELPASLRYAKSVNAIRAASRSDGMTKTIEGPTRDFAVDRSGLPSFDVLTGRQSVAA